MSKSLLLPLVAVFSLNLVSAEHIPWRLDGAQDRIEAIRQGDCHLRLVLPDGQTIPKESVYSLSQTRHAFNFGGSLASDWQAPKQDWYDDFKAQFANLFNYATIDFYWAVHEKEPGGWSYNTDSREKLNWAKAQGMTLRGHPLMWHEVLPDFMTDSERDTSAIEADIVSHVDRLLTNFPEIDEWDVYNEAPGIKWRSKKEGVRRWFESVGGPSEVTEKMLCMARSIHPNGRYILNHYTDLDVEYEESIEHCLLAGADFEVIGIQTHMHTEMDSIDEDRLWKALERYGRFGKPLHLSEISILSCERFSDWDSFNAWKDKVDAYEARGQDRPTIPSTPDLERYQAELARDFYTLAFSHPAVESIIWWTITDLEPWRGMPAGLLDAEGNAKPAYHALDQLINQEWNTQIEASTAQDGRTQFRGFYGSYTVTVQHEGETWTGEFDLRRGPLKVQNVVLQVAPDHG